MRLLLPIFTPVLFMALMISGTAFSEDEKTVMISEEWDFLMWATTEDWTSMGKGGV